MAAYKVRSHPSISDKTCRKVNEGSQVRKGSGGAFLNQVSCKRVGRRAHYQEYLVSEGADKSKDF